MGVVFPVGFGHLARTSTRTVAATVSMVGVGCVVAIPVVSLVPSSTYRLACRCNGLRFTTVAIQVVSGTLASGPLATAMAGSSRTAGVSCPCAVTATRVGATTAGGTRTHGANGGCNGIATDSAPSAITSAYGCGSVAATGANCLSLSTF